MKKIFLIILSLVNLYSQDLLNDKVKSEINILSTEIENKTGIKTGVLISDEIPFKQLSKEIVFKNNYAFIVMNTREKRLAVISDLNINFSSITKYYYLKYGFLPTQGTVLPLLTEIKGKDNVNAAVLNGFGELCDLIANYKHIKLENSIGNANDDFINILRIIFYVLLIFLLIKYIKRKKNAKRR